MVLWMLNWVVLMAVGLALESMLSLLTAEFAPCQSHAAKDDSLCD